MGGTGLGLDAKNNLSKDSVHSILFYLGVQITWIITLKY